MSLSKEEPVLSPNLNNEQSFMERTAAIFLCSPGCLNVFIIFQSLECVLLIMFLRLNKQFKVKFNQTTENAINIVEVDC